MQSYHPHATLSAWHHTQETNALLPIYAVHLNSSHQFEGCHHFSFHQVTLTTSPLPWQQFQQAHSPIDAQTCFAWALVLRWRCERVGVSKGIFLGTVLLREPDLTRALRTKIESPSFNLIPYISSTFPANGCRQVSVASAEDVMKDMWKSANVL